MTEEKSERTWPEVTLLNELGPNLEQIELLMKDLYDFIYLYSWVLYRTPHVAF